MHLQKPYIIAEVELRPTSEGGRKGPTPSDWFGCVIVIDEENFDCRLLLGEEGPIFPGERRENVPIKFLSPNLVLPLLSIGKDFKFWEGGIVGDGIVTRMVQ